MLEKHQAQMDLSLTFVLINNILHSEFSIAYFQSGLRHILLFRGNLFQPLPNLEKTHSNFLCQNNVKILLAKAFSKLDF